MKPIGIGLIGCGGRLRQVARNVTEGASDLRVVAVHDTDPGSIDEARKLFGAVPATDTVAGLVTRDDVDWVFVGSFNAAHAGHILAALEAGRHVFCEKPLATTVDDCLAIDRAVRASDRLFAFGLVLRSSPFYREVRSRIQGGAIGRLVSFEFNETIDFAHGGYIHGNWRRWRRLSGTHLLEKCCHDIDIANWMVDALPVRAASFGGCSVFTAGNADLGRSAGALPDGRPVYRSWHDPHGVDPFNDDKDIVDHQVAILEYANGVRATFHASCHAALPERRLYLLGTAGAIRGDVLEGSFQVGRVSAAREREQVQTAGIGGHGGADELLAEDLRGALRTGRRPPSGIREALTSSITCHAIDAALDSGSIVDLRPLWERAGIDPSAPFA